MIHREGKVTLVGGAIILTILCVVSYIYLQPILFTLLLVGSIALFTFITQFFRSPNRQITSVNQDIILAPADGTIVHIDKVNEPEYFQDDRIQMSIFMSPTNVHLNRVPYTGVVTYYKYHAGKYLVAFHPKSSLLNERNSCVIKNDKTGQEVLFRQIAGAVARRIVFYLKLGQQVKQGEELGFIKFGSRMDLFLPLGCEILVEKGAKTKAGITPLVRLVADDSAGILS